VKYLMIRAAAQTELKFNYDKTVTVEVIDNDKTIMIDNDKTQYKIVNSTKIRKYTFTIIPSCVELQNV